MQTDIIYLDEGFETLDEYIIRTDKEEQAKVVPAYVTDKAGVLKVLRIQYECLNWDEEKIHYTLLLDGATLQPGQYEVNPGNHLLYRRIKSCHIIEEENA